MTLVTAASSFSAFLPNNNSNEQSDNDTEGGGRPIEAQLDGERVDGLRIAVSFIVSLRKSLYQQDA